MAVIKEWQESFVKPEAKRTNVTPPRQEPSKHRTPLPDFPALPRPILRGTALLQPSKQAVEKRHLAESTAQRDLQHTAFAFQKLPTGRLKPQPENSAALLHAAAEAG